MGTLKPIVILAPLAALSLAGCYTPIRTAGPERAVALYRESRPRAASAPAQSGAPRTLTADEAVALALEHSASLAATEATAQSASAQVVEADRWRNPELRVSQLRLDQILDGDPHVATSVRLRPSRPGEVDAEVAEMRAEEAEARGAVRAEAIAIEAEVRWMFDDVRLLDAEIAALDGVAAARRGIATRMKARLEASEATAIDEAIAELSAAEAEQDSAEERERRRALLEALVERMGLPPGTPVNLVGDPMEARPLDALPSEEALVEAALRNRPEIAMAAARLDAADARGFMEGAKRWPWFTYIELGYEFAPGVRDGLGWTFEVGVELPVFDTNRGGVLAADAERAEAKRLFAAEVARVAREVRERLREARAAAALLGALRSRGLPAAERATVEAQRALESRAVDTFKALSADESRVKLQVRVLSLVRRYRTALAELRRAVGGKLPAAAK